MSKNITRSRGNVFEDLGFSAEEAANLKVRSILRARFARSLSGRTLPKPKLQNSSG
jgi:hypothetical protein